MSNVQHRPDTGPEIVRPRSTGRSGSDGFTLMEVTLAVVLLTIVMGAVAAMLASMIRHGQSSTSRTVAASLVSEEMAKVRQEVRTRFDALELGQVVKETTVDGVAYTVTREAQYVSESSTGDACSSGGSGADLAFLRVRVAVAWPGIAPGERPAHAETLIAPPAGGTYSDTGHLAVTVRNAFGGGSGGVAVSIYNGATLVKRLNTTDDGCAFFAYLPPGSYRVAISKSGYVDAQNNPAPEATALVTASMKTAVEFDYDRLAIIRAHPEDATGLGGAIPEGGNATLANPMLAPVGTQAVALSSSTPTTDIGVFPYSDGYRTWAGSCVDADPGAAFRPPPTPVTAGSTTDGVIPMASQVVTVEALAVDARPTLPAGAVADVMIRLVHQPVSGCPTGETITYDTSVVTDASGSVRIAVPLGTWSVQVIGTSHAGRALRASSGVWPTITITGDPADASRPPLVVAVAE